MPQCKINGCEKTNIAAHGLCWMHYARLRRTGDLDMERVNAGKTCSIEGCEDEANIRGMCNKHGIRENKHGSPHVIHRLGSYEDTKCLIPDCDSRARSANLCGNHYHNFKYHVRKGHIKNDVVEYLMHRDAFKKR